MGFFDGKLSVFRLGLRKNSGRSTHLRPASLSRTHDRQHRYRKRRFHVSPRALGVDSHNHSLATPSRRHNGRKYLGRHRSRPRTLP